nr:hypothetical protein [Tanacetum cinerariifolium]
MRPLIIIDGAHLKGTYLGTHLVVVGMDGNNQIIPIATGESQDETGRSWTWFLRKLKDCIDALDDELTPWATTKIMCRSLKSSNWSVKGILQYKMYEVWDNHRIHAVYLDRAECTCRRGKLSGLPCGHVCAVARVEGLTSVNYLAKPWFLNKTIKGTYKGLFFLVKDVSTWKIPYKIQQVLPPNMGKK